MMTVSKPTVTTIAFDADDTLWRNEDLFLSAQQEFVSMLTHYHDEQYILAHLGEVQVRNLTHFGYGIKGFTLSMIETAIELTEGRVTGSEVHSIIELARRMLEAPIKLIPSIEQVLSELKGKYQLMVITKGDLLDQEGKVARSGLAHYFDAIEVVSHKTSDAYDKLLNKHHIDKSQFLMIGNSLRSDVLPILDIGAKAIHIPYHTTWAHEEVSDSVLAQYPNLVTLDDVSLLPEWLSRHQ